MTTKPKRPTDHETLGRTFIDAAWNDRDDDQLKRLCSPTLVVHDHANPTAGSGPEAYMQFISRVTDGGTDADVAVDYVILADGKVAIHSSGTIGGAGQVGIPTVPGTKHPFRRSKSSTSRTIALSSGPGRCFPTER